MRLLPLTALVALSACATKPVAPPKPGIQVVYQRVEVPVAVACVDRANIPAEPAKVAGKLTGEARHDLDVVSGSAVRLRSWGQKMAALLIGCAKP